MAQDSPEGLTSECLTNDTLESEAATQRLANYNFFIENLNLQPETDKGCGMTVLTYGGSGA